MLINRFISPERIVLLQATKKEAALDELINTLCATTEGLDTAVISKAVWEREALFSTRIAPAIAVPHAQLPGIQTSYIVVGKSQDGVQYDAKNDQLVHLVFLLVGSMENHLNLLSGLARLLQANDIIDSLLAANGVHAIYKLLTEEPSFSQQENHVDEIISQHAGKIADDVDARVVMLYGENFNNELLAGLHSAGRRLVLVGNEERLDKLDAGLYDALLPSPYRGMNRSNQVELAMLMALSRGLLNKGDKVVNVFGLSGEGLDSIVVSDVARDFRLFFSFSSSQSQSGLEQQVFMRAMQIMAELAQEGREGKAVGALFVLGDYQTVQKHCQQMVINPFQGYDDSEKNLLDPSLTETIKEFSRIDGAFLIRGDGVVMSAGTYLRVDRAVTGLPSGLGARHTAAAGITQESEALSICLSESTSQISLFRSGERIMQIG